MGFGGALCWPSARGVAGGLERPAQVAGAELTGRTIARPTSASSRKETPNREGR
jgi:hypothetical protein